MSKAKQISGKNIALLLSRKQLPVVRLHSLSYRPTLGFLHSFSLPDYIEVIQSGAIQQTILFLVSAGNVSKVTTMRPDDSCAENKGVKVWYAKGQKGCFQLNCRTNY